jgi:SAM-dependent methyltransferase
MSTANFWNERFGGEEYVYGELPNVFFADELNKLPPGKIILPCEGEGRNAVFAAGCGWDVSAFDSSEAGRIKAMALARKKNVVIHYIVSDAVDIAFPDESVTVVAFIFSHFPPAIRRLVHQKAISCLKPGGKIILEAFNPKQLQNNSGGPKDVTMLYTKDMLNEDFALLKIDLLENVATGLEEGKHHTGHADVIRLVATKI